MDVGKVFIQCSSRNWERPRWSSMSSTSSLSKRLCDLESSEEAVA